VRLFCETFFVRFSFYDLSIHLEIIDFVITYCITVLYQCIYISSHNVINNSKLYINRLRKNCESFDSSQLLFR
jgi:hypothetical protein